MKHGHSCDTSNELEIGEVILIAQARVGIDLEGVVVPAQTRAQRKKVISIVSFPGYSVMQQYQWVYLSLSFCLQKP